MIDLVIVGGGFAGLTAAIYAKRAGLSVIVFEKGIYGGQVSITNEIENYPGEKKVTGVELATNIYNQALDLGAEIKFEDVIDVDFSSDLKIIKTNLSKYESKAVIIANGVTRRKLNCPGEEEFNGKGVSYCATCDGAFFKNETVSIVGGGNTALEDAVFLSNICSKVYLIHRRDEFRGDKILVDTIKDKKNIEILYNTIVEKIVGDKTVESLLLKNISKNESYQLNTNAVFIAIGLKPENEVFKKFISLDDYGYIISDENCSTNVKGVFAAGDTRTKSLRQIITAASDGAAAAFKASEYILTKY